MAESLWAGYFPLEWRDGWMYLFLVAMLVLIGAGRDQQTDRLIRLRLWLHPRAVR